MHRVLLVEILFSGVISFNLYLKLITLQRRDLEVDALIPFPKYAEKKKSK